MVVKETTCPAWPKFAEWAMTQTNIHLPNIYDLQVGDPTVATVELLKPFREHEFTSEELPLLYWILIQLPVLRPRVIATHTNNTFREAITLSAYFDKHKDELLEQVRDHPFIKTHDEIYNHFPGYGRDFKPCNIMVRPHTNHLVITDPIVGAGLRGNFGMS